MWENVYFLLGPLVGSFQFWIELNFQEIMKLTRIYIDVWTILSTETKLGPSLGKGKPPPLKKGLDKVDTHGSWGLLFKKFEYHFANCSNICWCWFGGERIQWFTSSLASCNDMIWHRKFSSSHVVPSSYFSFWKILN